MVDLCGYGFRQEKLAAVSLFGGMFWDNSCLLASYLQVEWLCSGQAKWLATHICTSCTHICFLYLPSFSTEEANLGSQMCWHRTSAEKSSISHIPRALLALQQSWGNETREHMVELNFEKWGWDQGYAPSLFPALLIPPQNTPIYIRYKTEELVRNQPSTVSTHSTHLQRETWQSAAEERRLGTPDHCLQFPNICMLRGMKLWVASEKKRIRPMAGSNYHQGIKRDWDASRWMCTMFTDQWGKGGGGGE